LLSYAGEPQVTLLCTGC